MLEPIEARVPVRTARLERLPQTDEIAKVRVHSTVLFDRLGRAVTQFVERLEDPARMLRLSRMELEGSLMAVNRDLRHAERDRKIAQRSADAQAAAETDWSEKIDLALAHDRDDLARLAIGQRLNAGARRLAAEKASASFAQAADTLRVEAERLRGAIAEVWTRQRGLADPFAEGGSTPDETDIDAELNCLKAARSNRAN